MSDIATEKISGRFYGVYLLCSQSLERHYRGKCYIGFTVNPTRRLKQHNAGTDFGGARKTSQRGPWEMVLIVHGFPNNIAALQFEWAWQNPKSSLRLKGYTDLQKKERKENWVAYNLRILNRMLLVGPWTRLPLIVRWLEPAYKCDLPLASLLPSYMKIVSGKIEVVNKSKKATDPLTIRWAAECHLCMQRIEQPEISRIGCLKPSCKLTCHLICLANYLLTADKQHQAGYYIPTAGECPLCEMSWTWAALVEHKRKISCMLTEEFEEDEDDVDLPSSDNENDLVIAHRVISKNSIDSNDVYVLSD